ncbi:MAG: NAD(P)H-dependent oxidoreductase subunit E [Planctomycetota bacterium]|nr:NAD(P)H-dependent oxidoreductase subunit E [Planctomycetota bacterium]
MSVAVVDKIVSKHKYDPAALIGVLQDVQKQYNYLPESALERVSRRLGVPLNRVYAVATFYRAFSLKPRGKHHVCVCLGTACHVRGAGRVAEELQRRLEIKPGGTTKDGLFSLEEVNCLGACALGPVVVVNGEYHGQQTSKRVGEVVQHYRNQY